MSKKLRTVVAIAAMIASVPLLSACNTTSGAGQDLQAAGKGMERSAEKNKGY